jgi:hypothetical protein
LLIAAAAGIGAAVLWDILAEALRRRDRTQLLPGLWLLLPLPVALYLHMPSKFQLAAAPAAALLVAREISHLKRRPARWVLVSTVALGVGLGVLILKADAVFAGLGRRAAAELIAPYTSLGKRVWFEGHWGFQWYAEKAGGRPLSAVPPRPSAGDYLVSSWNSAAFGNLLPAKRMLIATLADDSPGGRIMSFKDGTGFYSNAWGLLPWAWGSGLIDRFDLSKYAAETAH